MRIGEVAAKAGVNIQTLRYYERRKLLVPPRRVSSSYREYPEEAVQVVSAIKWAQGLGFALEEIRELLALNPRLARRASPAALRAGAQRKLVEIEERIARLEAMRSTLSRLLQPQPPQTCPLVLAAVQHAEDCAARTDRPSEATSRAASGASSGVSSANSSRPVSSRRSSSAARG